jgi:adenylate cyclase
LGRDDQEVAIRAAGLFGTTGRWAFVRLRRFARSRSGKAAGAAILALSALTVLRAASPSIVTELQERTFDAYQRIKPRAYADYPVRIADIDDASIAAFGQWPWSRARLAALTNRLAELGAAVVTYDILFSEPDRTNPARIAQELGEGDTAQASTDVKAAAAMLAALPDHDQAFAAALGKTSSVLGFAGTSEPNDIRPPVKSGLAFVGVEPRKVLPAFRGAIVSLPALTQAAAGVGGLNVSARDRSGIIRRIPMLSSDGDHVYPGLAAETLRVAQQQKGITVRGTGASGETDTGRAALLDMRVGEFRIPLTEDGEMWVYYDRNRAERYVSVKDIMDPAREGEVKPKIEGCLILIGASAAGLQDRHATTLGQTIPSAGIQAQILEQILAHDFITRPDWADGLETVMTFAMGAFVAIMLLSFGAQYSLLAGAIALVLAVAGSWFGFSQFRLLIDPIYPSLATTLTYVAVERVLHVASDKEKKFARRAFGQYLAPELLARLEASPQAMQLGGEDRNITIMFMDVRGFTPISEQMTATELVEFINTLLAPLSDAIQSELGTIDKYIGDSIMAFWNAPLDIADHTARACRAALKMREVVRGLNDSDAFGFAARGFDDATVRIGIGLNAGFACVGNMGSAKRFNYSAMGDVVNVAARIESATKSFGVDILVSQDVARAAPAMAFLEGGEILLKGKSQPSKLLMLVGDEQLAQSPEFAELARLHGNLLDCIDGGSHQDGTQLIVACRALAPPALQGAYDVLAEKLPAAATTAPLRAASS